MLLLIVWIVAGLVVLVVLGSVLFGVVSSLRRLGREVAAFQSEVQPVLEQAQRSAARAEAVRERQSEND